MLMESSIKNCAQEIVAHALRSIAANGAWWYTTYGDRDNESSIAHLLGVDYTTLLKIYHCCGWSHAYSSSNNQPRFLQKGFDFFCSTHNLAIESDKFNRNFYIRIGSFSKAQGKFTCKMQTKQGIVKPRIGSAMRRNLDKLIVELTLIAESSSTIIQAATDREVKEQCHGIVEALKQFDVLFAMLRIKKRSDG